MEFDVMAESTDGKALLVGECKWTNPEIAADLYKKLVNKISVLPLARNKEIIPVLFLKSRPKDDTGDMNIFYPQDVIDMMLSK